MILFHLILPYTIWFVVADNTPVGVYDSKHIANNAVHWETYIKKLNEASSRVLQNIRNNIKHNYFLDSNLISLMDEFFSDIGEHDFILLTKLKTIISNKKFNDTKEFMLDFMDMSNILINKMVEFNLGKIELITPTKWYKTLKDKIQRQESKAATAYVENQICKIGVCKEKKFYTDYLKNWFRYILNLNSTGLNIFFQAALDALERHKHFVKSNVKFRRTVKTILNSDIGSQKDVIDFVDEVLIYRDRTLYIIPETSKKSAGLLNEVFSLIDSNYDVNKENTIELENVNEMFTKILEENYTNVSLLLDKVVNNIKINLEIWPLKVQSRIYYLWSLIIEI